MLKVRGNISKVNVSAAPSSSLNNAVLHGGLYFNMYALCGVGREQNIICSIYCIMKKVLVWRAIIKYVFRGG